MNLKYLFMAIALSLSVFGCGKIDSSVTSTLPSLSPADSRVVADTVHGETVTAGGYTFGGTVGEVGDKQTTGTSYTFDGVWYQ
jgi:hypothetical protein